MLLLLPEIVLLIGSLLILLLSRWLQRQVLLLFTSLGLLLAVLVVQYFISESKIWNNQLLDGHLKLDVLTNSIKLWIIVLTGLCQVYSYAFWRNWQSFRGEFFCILNFALLGLLLIVSANSFVLAFIGLEVMSLSICGLIAWQRYDEVTIEATFKYFVINIIASAVLLYGISFLYGAGGSLLFSGVHEALATEQVDEVLVLLGLILFLVAILIKLAVIPFHMWLADVFEGGMTPVIGFLSGLPMFAIIVLFFRVYQGTLSVFDFLLQDILLVLGSLSVVLGNLLALAQRDIKRLLAYLMVAQMGCLLLVLLPSTAKGFTNAVFYVTVFGFVSVILFGVLSCLSTPMMGYKRLTDLPQLTKEYPTYAVVLTVALLTMAGIAPTAGFWSKLSVFTTLMDMDQFFLTLLIVVFSLVGSYCYLRMIYFLYFYPLSSAKKRQLDDVLLKKSKDGWFGWSSADAKTRSYRQLDWFLLLLIVQTIVLIGMGVFPDNLMSHFSEKFASVSLVRVLFY